MKTGNSKRRKRLLTVLFVCMIPILGLVTLWGFEFWSMLGTLELPTNDRRGESIELESGVVLTPTMRQILRLGATNRQFEDGPILQGVTSEFKLWDDCPNSYQYCRSIGWDELGPVLAQVLLGVEDARFLEHQGVDWKAIARALWVDIKSWSLAQGGSTITQQLVKNLWLGRKKTLDRKFREAVAAVLLERVFTKEEILTLYLNHVYWGTQSGVRLKGAAAAAWVYFAKLPRELSPMEALILVSMLKGPGIYRPGPKLHLLKRRVEANQKALGRPKAELWSEQEWQSWSNDPLREKRAIILKGSEGGWRKALFKLAATPHLKRLKKLGDASIRVLSSSIQGSEQFRYYSKIERDEIAAIETERFQVGSLLKPILFHIFVNLGVDPTERISGEPLTMRLKSGTWTPKEASLGLPDYTLEEALKLSRNVPFIRKANELGMEVVAEQLAEFVPRLKTPLSEYPSQLLGAVEMSVSEVVRAYQKLANTLCYQGQQQIRDLLSDPSQTTIRYRAKQLENFRFLGKTGTTNGGKESWFVSWSGEEVMVVLAAFETNGPSSPKGIGGSSVAFPIAMDFWMLRPEFLSSPACSTL